MSTSSGSSYRCSLLWGENWPLPHSYGYPQALHQACPCQVNTCQLKRPSLPSHHYTVWSMQYTFEVSMLCATTCIINLSHAHVHTHLVTILLSFLSSTPYTCSTSTLTCFYVYIYMHCDEASSVMACNF